MAMWAMEAAIEESKRRLPDPGSTIEVMGETSQKSAKVTGVGSERAYVVKLLPKDGAMVEKD
jgi:hypothetical protein